MPSCHNHFAYTSLLLALSSEHLPLTPPDFFFIEASLKEHQYTLQQERVDRLSGASRGGSIPLKGNHLPYEMAIGQAVYPSHFFTQEETHRQYTENCNSSLRVINQSAFVDRKAKGERRVPGGGYKGDMGKENRTLSSGAAKSNGKSSGGSNVSKARPIDTPKKGRGKLEHRRGSSQTLTLDLEGLDLGRGMHSESVLDPTKEEVAVSKGFGTSPIAFATSPLFRSRGPPGRRSIDAARKLEQTPVQTDVEDSFFAHLRNCEESTDILRTEEVLPLPTLAQEEARFDPRSPTFPGESSKQVLGGFASLGYESAANSRNNLHYFDQDQSGQEAVPKPLSPRAGAGRPLPIVSTWGTLVPILHDPMDTLDILSIEEMGLHSIDVGSSEDWEGVTLAYPCETCEHNPSLGRCDGVDAQWAVARSMKRQRKWIVTPRFSSSSRTIVVSDHVTLRQEQMREQASNLDRPQTFSGLSTFELRFLQAGTSAPNNTIVLASPATHRKLVAKEDAASKKSLSLEATPLANSLGVHEEQSRPAAVSAVAPLMTIHDNDEDWPMMRSKAAKVAKKASRSRLVHSKSSSTIHASVPMIQLESRRPSLGRSISHESLAFTASPSRSTILAPNSTRSSIVASTDAHRSKLAHRRDSSGSLFGSSLVQTLPSESFRPFGDYSIGLTTPTRRVKPMVVPSTPTNLGPSPRSSMQDVGVLRAQRESPSDRTPVLSTIDVARIAEYHRLNAANRQGGAADQFSGSTRWESAWQAPSSPSAAYAAKSTGRKDRRLSEWIKKKVLPGGPYQPAILSPPLPPAWEQKRDLRWNPDQAPSVSNSNNATIRATAKAIRPAKAVKSYSSTSKSSAATSNSARAKTAAILDASLGGELSSSSAHNSPGTASNSSLSFDKESNGRPSMDVRSSPMPLSQMQTYHGYNVWPGVVPQRSERRRSNSDDNLATLGEMEKRRLEVLGREGASRKGRMMALRGSSGAGFPTATAEDDNDTTLGLSSSMPTHSAMEQFEDHRASPTELSIDLLGLDDAPLHCITMLVPLPLSKRDEDVPLRYVRVSFVPFGAESVHEEDNSQDSIDLAMLQPPNLTPSQGQSTAWYKKLTNAWSANMSARSSSSGSNEDDFETRGAAATGTTTTNARGGAVVGAAAAANGHAACFAPMSSKRRNSTVNSFRIIARVLDSPGRAASAAEEALLPPTFPFPVILGVCDRQRSLKLIPEGWQAIQLADGPTEANTGSPLEGLADLIIAGCAACMDL